MELDAFTAQFIETALTVFSDSDEWTSEEPPTISDLAPITYAHMVNGCSSFKYAASEYFKGRESDAGHDFLMTRNGHGCGFWDGDWPEPAATILTVASKACGELELTVGDDGKIYD